MEQPGFTFDSYLKAVDRLQIDRRAVAGIGSVTLAAADIRRARDVDLVVPQKVFLELQASDRAWNLQRHELTNSLYIQKGPYDISTEWHNGAGKTLGLDELAPMLVEYQGLRLVRLRHLLGWKETQLQQPGSAWRHDKDREDVRLMRNYISAFPESPLI